MDPSQVPNSMLIKKLDELFKWRVDRAVADDDMTVAQTRILRMLHIQERTGDGSLSMKELEDTLRVAQSTCAGMVARLERKGLVQAARSIEDRRVKRICLTDSGRERCEATQRKVEETEALIVSGMSGKEQEEFHRLLLLAHRSLSDDVCKQKGAKSC